MLLFHFLQSERIAELERISTSSPLYRRLSENPDHVPKSLDSDFRKFNQEQIIVYAATWPAHISSNPVAMVETTKETINTTAATAVNTISSSSDNNNTDSGQLKAHELHRITQYNNLPPERSNELANFAVDNNNNEPCQDKEIEALTPGGSPRKLKETQGEDSERRKSSEIYPTLPVSSQLSRANSFETPSPSARFIRSKRRRLSFNEEGTSELTSRREVRLSFQQPQHEGKRLSLDMQAAQEMLYVRSQERQITRRLQPASIPLDGIYQWNSNTNTSSSFASTTPPLMTTPYHIRVLFLVPDRELFRAHVEAIYRDYHILFEDRCNIYVQEITSDRQISQIILRYNPSVIVSTGNHWMQLLLSGLCNERRVPDQEFQSVDKLHGSILQINVYGSIRYLFPLIGYGRRSRPSSPTTDTNSAGGSPCSSPPSSPSKSLDESTGVDLTRLMLFISQQIEAMSPVHSGNGSPTGSSSHSPPTVYDSLYGGGRKSLPSSPSEPNVTIDAILAQPHTDNSSSGHHHHRLY